MRYARHSGGLRRVTARIAVWCLVIGALAIASATRNHPAPVHVPATKTASTARLTGTPLLLIHGYSDSCSAFTTTDVTDAGSNAATTLNYLTGNGFARSQIKLVGYYDAAWSNTTSAKGTLYGNDTTSSITLSNGHTVAGQCDTNTYSDSVSGSDAVSKCSGYASSAAKNAVYVNDNLMHLACMMAWYIYDNYTAKGQPVNILAHSMGGLVVRGAMAFSGGSHQLSGFPTSPLLADRIVTVASPLGGLQGPEAAIYANADGSTQVKDMTVCPNLASQCTASILGQDSATMTTSQFMTKVLAAGTPHGANDAIWMLMGSGSAPSLTNARGGITSYANAMGTPYLQFADADFVVTGESAMSMDAAAKIYYGDVDDETSGASYGTGGVIYDHEANTCQNTGGIFGEECTSSPYYLNDGTGGTTAAWYCSGNCTNGLAGIPYTQSATQHPYALGQIKQWLLAPPVSQTGHAVHAGDDYPYSGLGMYERSEGVDPWTEFYGQCDGFAAWKVYENLGGNAAPGGTGAVDPTSIPVAGFTPGDAGISPVVGYAGQSSKTGTWGDATDWLSAARSFGVPEDNVPQPGSIAVWTSAETGWTFGHVGYVTDVFADGSIIVESYNLRVNGQWSSILLTPGSGGVDTSFHLSGLNVPWPAGFVHLGDGAGGLGAQPLPNPTSHYSANTWGPYGSGSFTLGGSAYPGSDHGWYLDGGHGENGSEEWTNTHAGNTDSTATWTPPLTSGQCYEVQAFVPNNYSNDATALYEVSDAHYGSSAIPINENNYTNAFAPLGVFQAGSSGIPVTLVDNGPASHYVAADGLRYRHVSCANYYRYALVIDSAQPGFTLAGSAYTGTVHGWYSRSGHGLRGNELWTNTHAGNPDSTATYSATLAPSNCYTISAFVPDNYSNSSSALYKMGSSMLGSVNENAYTNNWAVVGTMYSDSSGSISTTLTDNSPSGEYVAADAVSFVPGCSGTAATAPVLDRGTSGFSLTGSAYPGTVDGWYSNPGYGLRGNEDYTYTNGPTLSSTANWQPVLNTGCYSVNVFVPNEYANNPATAYTVNVTGSSSGYGYATKLDMTKYNNAWATIGSVNVAPGDIVKVTVNDSGTTGNFVAADAVQFLPATC